MEARDLDGDARLSHYGIRKVLKGLLQWGAIAKMGDASHALRHLTTENFSSADDPDGPA